MPLGTLERSAPPFFKQGPSALSRLAVFSALALFLMVADARFQITGPFRQAVATVLYPVQWLMLQPVEFASHGRSYFQSLQTAQEDLDAARKKMTLMGQRANQAEQLALENGRLRKLLELRDRLETPARAAQVIYDTADPYTRRVVIDQGQAGGIELGAPVMDEAGVLGQVTRVFPFVSEITLITDKDQSIPVQIVRNGLRSVVFGLGDGQLELRFMPANADVQNDDLLVTSGLDGVFLAGLPVAKVVRVERDTSYSFARIYCEPLAGVENYNEVMILDANEPIVLPDKLKEGTSPAAKSGSKAGLKKKRQSAVKRER